MIQRSDHTKECGKGTFAIIQGGDFLPAAGGSAALQGS